MTAMARLELKGKSREELVKIIRGLEGTCNAQDAAAHKAQKILWRAELDLAKLRKGMK